MSTAKILTTEKNQTVILPNDIHLLGEEIFIKQIGDAVVLIPKDTMWQSWFNDLNLFSNDILLAREQPQTQYRTE